MRRGEGWLPEHPERALITRRYLKHEWRLVNPALAALGELEPADDRTEIALERPVSLKDQRLGTVQAVLKASGARSVIDLGCGAGALLERLLKDGYDRPRRRGRLCPRARDRRAATEDATPSRSCTARSPTGTSGSRTTTPRRWSR